MRFSKLQKFILITAFNKNAFTETEGISLKSIEIINQYFKFKNNAARASTSRVFKTLNEKGLVNVYEAVYSNWVGIKLTPNGVETARRLKSL